MSAKDSLWAQLRGALTGDAGKPQSQDSGMSTRMAAAVLMLATEWADHQREGQERDEIRRQLIDFFDLDKAEAKRLLEAAQSRANHAVSLHDEISALNEALDYQDKVQVVEMLWRVALADEELHKYEEALIRELAELLHVRHADFIKAKLAVTET